eukprot:6286727-Prymnesium_polylepis.2
MSRVLVCDLRAGGKKKDGQARADGALAGQAGCGGGADGAGHAPHLVRHDRIRDEELEHQDQACSCDSENEKTGDEKSVAVSYSSSYFWTTPRSSPQLDQHHTCPPLHGTHTVAVAAFLLQQHQVAVGTGLTDRCADPHPAHLPFRQPFVQPNDMNRPDRPPLVRRL